MHNISWLAIILFSVPECILVIALGLLLINNYSLTVKKLLLIAILYSPFVYIIRSINMPYGLNTILLCLVVIFLTFFIGRISIFKCTIAIIIGLVIDLSLETIFIPLLSFFTHIPFSQILQTPMYNVVFGLPQLLVMFFLVIYLQKKTTICLI